MFLLAPAFFMPGYERYTPERRRAARSTIVHGWNDDDRARRRTACATRGSTGRRCTCIDSDHRLTANVDEVCELLDRFLRRVLAAA